MARFTAQLIAPPGHRLAPYDGIPDLFLPLINDAWLPSDTAGILAVLLPERTAEAWAELGGELLRDILTPGGEVGLCLDGDWPAATILTWLQRTDEQDAPAVIELQWLLSAHPVLPTPTHNVRWISLHQTAPSWLSSLWTTVGSDRFHVGCDLIVVAYRAALVAQARWDEPTSITAFGRTLTDASAWVMPLDANRGFLVGARVGTPLHAKLVGRA